MLAKQIKCTLDEQEKKQSVVYISMCHMTRILPFSPTR